MIGKGGACGGSTGRFNDQLMQTQFVVQRPLRSALPHLVGTWWLALAVARLPILSARTMPGRIENGRPVAKDGDNGTRYPVTIYTLKSYDRNPILRGIVMYKWSTKYYCLAGGCFSARPACLVLVRSRGC